MQIAPERGSVVTISSRRSSARSRSTKPPRRPPDRADDHCPKDIDPYRNDSYGVIVITTVGRVQSGTRGKVVESELDERQQTTSVRLYLKAGLIETVGPLFQETMERAQSEDISRAKPAASE